MIKLLIGGSPCTFWSIAQSTDKRERQADGIGWELFKNYLIAKEKFCPDFFLYENNKSAAQPIKDQIKHELQVYDGTLLTTDTGARYIEINSALVSAQKRQRFYVHNCGNVEQPADRGILLKDILETNTDAVIFQFPHGFNRGGVKRDKSPTVLASGTWQYNNLCVEPCRVGALPRPDGTIGTSQSTRIYGIDGKSVTLNAGGGGLGAKTGLYAIPIVATNNERPIYEVKNGIITINGKQYPIKLADGFYLIRKLTVTECCRLQTLPDDYCRVATQTQAYKGIGNGWTAEVIIHILHNALKDVPKDEKIVVLSMYDGIGTGRYCLDKMGFSNVDYYAYEIDKNAIKIAQSNFPDIIQLGDAFDLRKNDWVLPLKKPRREEAVNGT